MGLRPILVRYSNSNNTERGNGLKIDVIYRTRYRLNSSLSKHRARTTTGGINLYIELEKHKLDRITARNLRMSLDKRIAFSK